jgi:TolB-like protein/DNA-binding winged helix-turn-helix (wHTH) protein
MEGGVARLVARFDGWTLRRMPLELLRGEQPVRLQEQPLQVLEALLLRPGELVTREELTARLWPDTVVDFEAGLNTAVRKLRVALADDADVPRYVETVPRQGYRFIGQIERLVERRDDGSVMEGPRAPTPALRLEGAVGGSAAGRHSSWTRAGLALVGLVAAVAAVAFVATRPPVSSVAPVASLRPPAIRLAVLPFTNLSPDPANAFFADGMHEELLSVLGSHARNFEVISRTTMMPYRAHPTSMRALARELQATHVLEGSVRREATTVRVSLQLVDAVADRQIWSRSYERTLVDAMRLQTELSGEVVGQLAGQLPVPSNAQRPPPRSPEAYDEWLKGALAWQQVGGGGATDQEIARVEAMFTRAIELDDTYAAAYADRGRVRIAKHASRADGSEANVANARADIALAQKYAGGTSHVLVRAAQLAFLVDDDLGRALGLIEAAEQVGSLDADLLLTKGNFLMFAGRLEESLVTHAQAARLDPGNATIFRFWVSNLAAARRPVEAMRVLRDFDSKYPGRLYRGEYIFAFTGSTAAWWDEVGRLRTDSDPNAPLSSEFDLLRYEQRFAELRARLDAASSTFAQHSAFEARVGASRKPVAELRGWERLLAGDARGAAREGAELAAFVERLPKSTASEWWRRLLGAESALMLGEQARAIDDTRVAMRLVGNPSTFAESLHVRLMAARVLAWAGEEDEAVALLETLARAYPGSGPATIVRDPLFSMRLSSNPHWRALERALNAELAANQALLTSLRAR